MTTDRWSRLAWQYACAGSVVALLIALLAMVGWHARIPILVQWSSTYAPMQYNTALCFVLCAVGLQAVLFNYTRLALASAAAAVVIGLVASAEYAFDLNTGLDRLFMEPYITVATSHPGRMAPNTAIAFVLAGAGIILAARRRGGRYLNAGNLGALSAAGGVTALLGYLSGVEGAYAWGGLTRMAVHTSICFSLIGTGLLAHEVAVRSRFLLHQLQIPAGLAIGVVTVAFFMALLERQEQIVRERVAIANDHVLNAIEYRVDDVKRDLLRLTRNWRENTSVPSEQWMGDAQAIIEDHDALQAIEWADSSQRIRWVVPLEGNEAAQGFDLAFDSERRDALELAHLHFEAVATENVDLVEGGRGFIVVFPITQDVRALGSILAVFRLEELCSKLFEAIDTDYLVSVREDDHTAYSNGTKPAHLDMNYSSTFALDIFGKEWQVEITPMPQHLDTLKSTMPVLLLVTGLIIAVVTIGLIQVSAGSMETARSLAQSEAHQRSIIRSMPNGLITTDQNGIVLDMNPEASRQFGYELEELAGKSIEILVGEETRSEIPGAWEEARDSTSSVRAGVDERLRAHRKDGSTFPIEVALTRLPDLVESNVLVTVIDHSEQDAAREALLAHEQQFRSIIDNSTAVIYMKRVDGRYILINRRFQELFGMSQEDIAGKTDFEIWPEEFARAFTSNDRLVAETATVVEKEEVAPHDDGEHTYLSIKFPIRDAQGEVYAIAGISTDITERKRATEAIRRHGYEQERLNNQLKQVNEELNQFAYVASHDLQEPLRTIITYCGFIQEDIGDHPSDDIREDLSMLVAASKRMQRLVYDLLKFSRSGRGDLEKKPVALKACVDEALENLHELITERDARILIDALPILSIDAGLMTQVIQNLVANAIKFCKDTTPQVEISAVSSDGTCTVSIADNGIGIDPKYMNQIFSPFKRLHSAHEYEGSGIGLSVCQKIINRHQGRIWVEAREPTGSIFKFKLPDKEANK